MLVLCLTPYLSDQQFLLSLILIDLYDKHKTNRFNVDELYGHGLMTTQIRENLEQLLPTIIAQKIVNKYQRQYDKSNRIVINNDPKPINYIFEYIDIIDEQVLLVVTKYYWDYLSQTTLSELTMDEKFIAALNDDISNIKLFFWVLTWQTRGETTCLNNWLEMYLNIDEGYIHENQTYFEEVIEQLQKFDIYLKPSFFSVKYAEKTIWFTTLDIVKPKRKIKSIKRSL